MRYREVRLPCDTEATILMGDAPLRARFVNLSPGGARLAGLPPLPPDALVVLQVRGQRHMARIAWSEGGEIGLRFPVRLSDAEIALLRGVGMSHHGSTWVPVGRLREMT